MGKLSVLVLFVCCLPAVARAQVSPESGKAVLSESSSTPEKPEKDRKTKADQKPRVDDAIVVTATRSERHVSDLPVSTTVIRESEIKSAPAQTVDDLLRTVPGVNMPIQSSRSDFAQSSSISMHGLGGTRALVLLDGIPIHDPYYGTVEWQKVPLDTLRQIEVVRGGTASLFGNFALGGTINLMTRSVDSNTVTASASYGTAASGRESLMVDQLLGERAGIRIGHERFNTNGTWRTITRGAVDIPAWNDTSMTHLRADFRPTDQLNGFFKASWAQFNMSQGTKAAYENRGIFDASSALHWIVGNNALVSTTLFYQHENHDQILTTVNSARTVETVNTASTMPASESGASAEWSLQRRGPLAFISAGVDISNISGDESRQTPLRSGAIQYDDVSGAQRFGGLFAQASWRPLMRMEVLASARIDYFRNAGGSDAVAGGATTRYPASTTTQFDPRLSVRYELASKTIFRASAYRAFKAATLRDLYRQSQSGSTILMPNPNLAPETLVGGEAGLEWLLPRGHFEVNAFQSDVSGLQIRVRRDNNISDIVNAGRSRSRGIEAMGQIDVTPSLNVDLGYTWTDARLVDNPADRTLEGKIIPGVIPEFGSIGLRYTAPFGTMISLRERIASRSYGEATNVIYSPAHRVLDVSLSHPLRPWLEVYAIGENVLNDRYVYVVSVTNIRPALPRLFTAGLRMNVPSPWSRH